MAARPPAWLDYATARAAIDDCKRELMIRNEATPLFGNERGEALQGILGSIEQNLFGEPLDRSRDEKAAHLLYFVIKDRPILGRQQAHRLVSFHAVSDAGKAWRHWAPAPRAAVACHCAGDAGCSVLACVGAWAGGDDE